MCILSHRSCFCSLLIWTGSDKDVVAECNEKSIFNPKESMNEWSPSVNACTTIKFQEWVINWWIFYRETRPAVVEERIMEELNQATQSSNNGCFVVKYAQWLWISVSRWIWLQQNNHQAMDRGWQTGILRGRANLWVHAHRLQRCTRSWLQGCALSCAPPSLSFSHPTPVHLPPLPLWPWICFEKANQIWTLLMLFTGSRQNAAKVHIRYIHLRYHAQHLDRGHVHEYMSKDWKALKSRAD